MTQGAGQGPEMRTPTVRDFRVPAYVNEAGPYTQSPGPYTQSGEVYDQTAEPYHQTGTGCGSMPRLPTRTTGPVPTHGRRRPGRTPDRQGSRRATHRRSAICPSSTAVTQFR